MNPERWGQCCLRQQVAGAGADQSHTWGGWRAAASSDGGGSLVRSEDHRRVLTRAGPAQTGTLEML